MLSIRDLHAGYDGRSVLRGISLDAVRGSVLALCGPNGAGKSTLLKALCGLVPSCRGSVVLRGEEVLGRSVAELGRRGLVYVPQGAPLFGSLTVEENLFVAASAIGGAVAAEHALDRVYGRLPSIGAWRNRKGGELSGGQRQLVALGMGIVKQPEVLLLDEPTLGLAPNARRVALEQVEQVAKEGCGVILAEQNVGEAISVADEVAVLRLGAVVLQVRASDVSREQLRRAFLGD